MGEQSRYKGKIESAVLNGEGTFTVEEEGLSCSMLFDEEVIPYADTDAFRYENYSVYVSASGKNYRFFHMGQQNEWMFNEFYTAYNQKVLSALMVTENPILSTEGVCAYDGYQERAKVFVFPDCICILPQCRLGRRYPFVFMNGLNRENFALSVSLSTGEACTFTMLGPDFDPLERDIKKRVQETREENRAFISDVCPDLPYSDTASASKILHEGLVAPISSLSDVLKGTLIKKAKNSKMGAYYEKLLSLGERSMLAIGLKALEEEIVEELKAALLEKLNANAEEEVTLTPEQEDALKWIVWAALPTPDGHFAIVEFAFPNEDSATYVFKMDTNFKDFLTIINRAFEATQLGRELISADETKLSEDMRMLIERTPAVARLRKCYAGKGIHRNPEAWAKSITAITAPEVQSNMAFCPHCGTKLQPDTRFCGQCGAKL